MSDSVQPCSAGSAGAPRYFVNMYTDGPATSWNVIDRQTQEWFRRFPTEAEAREYADSLNWHAAGRTRAGNDIGGI